jgi:hypothetical protein
MNTLMEKLLTTSSLLLVSRAFSYLKNFKIQRILNAMLGEKHEMIQGLNFWKI